MISIHAGSAIPVEEATLFAFDNQKALDAQGLPIAGYSGESVIPVMQSGLRLPVVWRNQRRLLARTPVCLRVRLRGDPSHRRPRAYALYLDSQQ